METKTELALKKARKKDTKKIARAKPAPILPQLAAHIHVPDCAMMYASAMVDPFDTPSGACIPAELFPVPSQKVKQPHTGRFQLGTTGIGFIAFNPCLTGSTAELTCTGSTSVGTASTAFNAFTNLTSSANTLIPYTTAQMSAGSVFGRIVSYGLRVKYLGSNMNRSGIAFAMEDPDHLDVMSLTCDGVGALPYTSRKRIGPDLWDQEVCYSGPTTPGDVEFTNLTEKPLNNGANARVAVIAINGAAGDIYEYEAFTHYEYTGSAVSGRTHTHADPINTAKVLETSKGFTESKPLQSSDTRSFFQKFFDGIRNTMPTISAAGKTIKQIVTGNLPEAVSTAKKVFTNAYGAITGASSKAELGYVPGVVPLRIAHGGAGSGPTVEEMNKFKINPPLRSVPPGMLNVTTPEGKYYDFVEFDSNACLEPPQPRGANTWTATQQSRT